MGRKVTQVSPQTVIKHTENGTRDTIWASGFKIDKGHGSEMQYIYTRYFEPQEVKIKLAPKSRWGSETSSDRITMVTTDGEEITRWKAVDMGVKFFKTQALAEQYFLLATHNLYTSTSKVMKLHGMFLDKISHDNPHFVNEL